MYININIYISLIHKLAKILYSKVPFKFGCGLPQNREKNFFWGGGVKNGVAQAPQSFKMAQNTTSRKFFCAISCNIKI